MLVINDAAVRNGKEKSFPEVKAGVPSNGQPKIPGSAQSQSKNQSGNRDVGFSNDSFAWVSSMDEPEKKRKQDRGGPESNASGKGELGVSSKQELFRESHKDENHRPKQSPAQQAGSVHDQPTERVSAKNVDQGQEKSHFRESEKNT